HGEHQHIETGSEHNHDQSGQESKTDQPGQENRTDQTEPKEHKHVHMDPAMDMSVKSNSDPSKSSPAQENLFESVILDEKLGAKIPLDLSFIDENGQAVKLSDLVDRPVLLQLVFYHCPQSCNFMMANLASILESVTFTPGKDYRIVTVSFDHEDTPAIASDTKSNYINLMSASFPTDQWKYLTGNLPEINALTSAVGFKFKRVEQHNFVHPNALIVLSHDGTVIRYLYGTEYLPFDVSMALTEAAKGTPSVSIKKLLTFCFDYDPESKKYVFKTFQVSGIVLLIVLGGFFFIVLRKGNKNRQKPTLK
ncbi:MAG: SCO family protein, partial [Desulfamplus sp.]|nr:SCO family protein [Desulfamplus sp.]